MSAHDESRKGLLGRCRTSTLKPKLSHDKSADLGPAFRTPGSKGLALNGLRKHFATFHSIRQAMRVSVPLGKAPVGNTPRFI